MKKINRLVLYLASGLLIGEIFCKNSIEITWGFVLVPIIIFISIISRRNKNDTVLFCLLFLVAVFIGNKLYENKMLELKKWDGIKDGIHMNISGEVANIWKTANGISVEIKCDGVKILCYFDEFNYKIGNTIEISGENRKIDVATNCGEFDLKTYYNSREIFLVLKDCTVICSDDEYSEIFHEFYLAREQLKRSILEICDSKEAGILCAILFGDKENLDEDIKNLYTQAGIGHILAISGLHISLAGGIVYKLLRRFVRQPTAFLTSASIMLCFCGISGGSVSTVRAVIMYIINVFSHVLGRKYDIKNAMAIALLWVLIDNPFYINNGGFILSFLSVAGIAFVLPVIDELFKELKFGKIIAGFVTSAVMYFVSLIVVADMYYEIPVYSIVLNTLLLPLMGVIVMCGFAGGILFNLIKPIGSVFVYISIFILKIYNYACELCDMLPFNTYVTGKKELWQIVVYYVAFLVVLVICVVMKRRKMHIKWVICTIMVGISFMLALVLWKKEYSFYVAFLDVGQGDCIYIESPDGCNFLVDGGSSDESKIGNYKIEPFLKSRGRDKISAVFITHTDIDHISGILQLVEEDLIEIENIMFAKYMPEQNEAYVKLYNMAVMKGIQVHWIEQGDVIGDDGLELVCISPMPDVTYKDINSSSIVLLGRYKEYKFLFTGDIGMDEEKTILESEYASMLKNLSILKVAHHGSKNSSDEEFLSLTSPEIAIILCGKDNSYGHPANRVVESLYEIGTKVCVSYECGMVWFEEENDELVWKRYVK